MPVEEALAIIARDVPQKLDGDARGALEAYVGQPLACGAGEPTPLQPAA